jgi:glycerol-3-phosphate acyltransferase PlsY
LTIGIDKGIEMSTSEIIAGVIAVMIAYLLGSFPSAYIITRWQRGLDIRYIGSGNVGGVNVYREVGMKAGITVAMVDISKGIAAVSIAYWLLDVTQLFILLVGLIVVAGHLWMVFLKFSGGGGMGTSVGVISILMPLYGYWLELLMFITIMVLVIIITYNAAFSAIVSLFLLPLIVWLGTHSIPVTLFSIGLGSIMILKFAPTIKREWSKDRTIKSRIFHNSFRRTK